MGIDQLTAGDRVIWTDPDGGNQKPGRILNQTDDDAYFIQFDDGSEGGAYDHELRAEDEDPPGTIITDEGAKFIPWTDGRAVGFKVTAEGKPDVYVYLNPSGAQDTGKLDDTDVFIYRGGDGDPSMDGTECYINVWEGQ